MAGCRARVGRLALAVALALPGRPAGEAPGPVAVARVQGTIGPATAAYLARARDEAGRRGAQCLLVELDTPGGLLDATREIVQGFLQSPVPTVVYVSPAGAWAGSAGCFITLAADVAAMAPATSIGAAHPVGIGPGADRPDPDLKRKLERFTSSYLEAIAARRHRNTAWALASVQESAALTSDQALAQGVIDLVARDRAELLARLDGREAGGRVLHTAGAATVEIPWSLRERVFQVLAHPQVMLILMLAVMYGLVGELTSPGAILPGVAGVIALVLLLYLGSVLPMRGTGLLLVGVAAALFVFDALAPTHGVLTVGGMAAFFLGTLLLFDRAEPFLRLSLAWLVPATVVTGLFFAFVVGAGIRAQRAPARTGAEALLGRTALALEPIQARSGRVLLEGEIWSAQSPEPIPSGSSVRIIAREGLTLTVQPVLPPEAPP